MTTIKEIQSKPEHLLLKSKKIAILHAFFKNKGGAEKLTLGLRNYYNADLYTGALHFDHFDPAKPNKDSFSKDLFDPNYKFEYFHKDSNIPIWRLIKRQLFFFLKGGQLNKYDLVIYTGNVAFAQGRINNPKVKKVNYCNTPPRPFTDQLENRISKIPKFLRPFGRILAKIVVNQYRSDLLKMDLIISNSENIQRRLQKYLGVDSTPIFVPVETTKYNYKSTGDYFLSHSRLEEMKRIPLIIEAFAQMPEKKLVVCSGGPLANWVKEQIQTRNLKNISFEGIVSDERLQELVENCLAGIVIPVDEDAGIVQCELMAAGKPVIGVNEGSIPDTVIDNETGFIIPANPTVDDLIQHVNKITPEVAINMKSKCEIQAEKFDSTVFYSKMDKALAELFK